MTCTQWLNTMDVSSPVSHKDRSLKTKRKKDDIPLKVLSGNLILQYLISSFWGCRESFQDLCFWVSSDLEQPFPYLIRFQWFDLVPSINLEWSNLQILNFITSIFKCLHMQKCQDVLLRLVLGIIQPFVVAWIVQ